MLTTVKFLSEKYGNYDDSYYTDDYEGLIDNLQTKVKFTRNVNLGVTDGVIIENNFEGGFQDINSAIVISEEYGRNLYKIIKKVFIRRNLWRITMVKDMVSSKYQEIMDSKVLVSRLGIQRNVYDHLLMMEEQMSLSEIKKKQINISETNSINKKSYGYLMIWKRDSLDGSSIKWQESFDYAMIPDFTVNLLNDIPIYDKVQLVDREVTRTIRYTDNYMMSQDEMYMLQLGYDYNTQNTQRTRSLIPLSSPYTEVNDASFDYTIWDSVLIDSVMKNREAFNSGDYTENIYVYEGAIIKEESTNKYYRVRIEYGSHNKTYMVSDVLANIPGIYINDSESWSNEDYVEETYHYAVFDEISGDVEVDHTLLSYRDTRDQPLQMIYIPYIEDTIYKVGNLQRATNKEIIETFLYSMLSSYSGENGKLIDVQVIPYLPFNVLDRVDNDEFDTYGAVEVIDAGGFVIPLYELEYSSYSRLINLDIDMEEDIKLRQKTKVIFTSPSGASNYEFSLNKNRGLNGVIVKVDLRPFSSYHQIQPIYSGMYGSNFKDTRGLIFNEDMSFTAVSSEWETYKRQNINYLNSFNAGQDYQKSELSLHHKTNWFNYGFDAGKRLLEAGVEAALFTADAVAKDVWFGAKGGVAGAVGGTAIMGAAVATEAVEAGQLAFNNQQERSLLSLTQENDRRQFNYALENIKALPENVDKVSGIYQSNNFNPYIQIFEPTQEEKEQYSIYLDTFGVNIGQVVDLRTRDFNYLQGSIIIYGGVITVEEYDELSSQLKRGVRKYEI